MQRWLDRGETNEGGGVESQEGRWRKCGGEESEEGVDCFNPEIAKCEIILTRGERIGLLARASECESEGVEDEGREAGGGTMKEDEDPNAEQEVSISAATIWAATDDPWNCTSSFERNMQPVNGLGSTVDEEDRYRLYNDDFASLRRYTDDDANKENCPETNNWIYAFDKSAGLQDYAALDETCFYDKIADGLTNDDDGGSFEPLPFSYDSQAYQTLSARSPQAVLLNTTGVGQGCLDVNDSQSFASQPLEFPDETFSDIDSLGARKTVILDQNLNSSVNTRFGGIQLVNQPLGAEGFAKLRSKVITSRQLDPLSVAGEDVLSAMEAPVREDRDKLEATTTRINPQELHDRRTLLLPLNRATQPGTTHRYMASLDVLQKQVLVRSLHSQECRVDLVERESLGGVDLILDPYTSVIFAPLLSLSVDHKTLLARISHQTWRYTYLLVVFEAYPSSKSSRTSSRIKRRVAGDEPELYAYTPPVVKAIKKFRRDLDIAEAYGTNDSRCEIRYAFADTVAEAAAYARFFGDGAEQRDQTRGALWGTREWLDLDMSEVCPSCNCSAVMIITCPIGRAGFGLCSRLE